MKLLKELPDFKSEDEEFEFWATHDSTEYFDMRSAKPIVFQNLHRGAVIEVTLSEEELQKLKALAKLSSKPFEVFAEEMLHEGLREKLAA